jgi:uncharacterized repeat protein (TIGR01451 family)
MALTRRVPESPQLAYKFCLLFAIGVVLLAAPTIAFAQTTSLLFQDKFDSQSFDGFKPAGNPTAQIVTSPVRAGTHAARLSLSRLTDTSRARTEIVVTEPKLEFGQTYWLYVSHYMPASWAPDSTIDVVYNIHSRPDPGEDVDGAPFSLRTFQDRWVLVIRGDPSPTSPSLTTIVKDFDLGPVGKDQWTDWVFRIKLSYNGDGHLEAWKQGVKVVDYVGPNVYNDMLGPFVKMGIYKPAWRADPATLTGPVTQRQLFLDQVQIRREFNPAGGVANLTIAKTDAPDPWTGEGNLVHTLTVTNNGPNNATGVKFSDTLPSSVQFVSASRGCTLLGEVVTCDVGTLAAGSSAIAEIVLAPLENGIITNTAAVTANQGDPNATNNRAMQQTTINTTGGPLVDVAATMGDVPDPVIAGSNLTYKATVINNGPDTATGVTLTDTLPTGVQFVSASANCTPSGGIVVCTIGNLPSGASVPIDIVVTPTAQGTLTNTAQVSANENDWKTINNTTSESTTVNPLTCNGRTVTVLGTTASETITGTVGVDVIHGLGGNDLINALDSTDFICGGEGNDTLQSGLGNDQAFGDNGNDFVRGSDGADHVQGGAGTDQLFGDQRNDALIGGTGTDRCDGGSGTDTASTCETRISIP